MAGEEVSGEPRAEGEGEPPVQAEPLRDDELAGILWAYGDVPAGEALTRFRRWCDEGLCDLQRWLASQR